MANLPKHSKFPVMWSNCKPIANPACAGCEMERDVEHESAVEFIASSPAPLDTRIDLNQWRAWQYRLFRMGLDTLGWYGSSPTHLYNARDSLNFTDAVGAEVVSIGGGGYHVTLKTAEPPLRLTLFQARRREAEFGMTWVNGYGGFGMIQPRMAIQMDAPSILASRKAMIKQIISMDNTARTTTVRIDQNFTNAMMTDDPETEEPDPWTCRVLNQEGNPQGWFRINDPKYFRGQPRITEVEVESLPLNKIFNLADVAVAHPPGFGTEAQSPFRIKGRRTDNAEIEELLNPGSRLFVSTTSAGAHNAKVAFGTQKPANATNPELPLVDLTALYDKFYIYHWRETSPEMAVCDSPCHASCLHQRPDKTESIDNTDAPYGTGRDAATGIHYYCAKAEFDVTVEVDTNGDTIPDSVERTWSGASGAVNFPTDGSPCLQHNTCSHWEAAENKTESGAPWRYDFHGSRVLAELWGAVNMRFVQFFPGIPYPSNFQDQRVKHDGLQEQAGLNLRSFNGFHPRVEFFSQGRWGTGWEAIQVSEFIRSIRKKWQHNFDIYLVPGADNTIEDGEIPDGVANFHNHRDPFSHAAVMSSNEIERLGIRNLRDDGAMEVRGLDNWPKVLTESSGGYTLIPDLRKETGTLDRTIATYERFASPQDVLDGVVTDIGARISILPLRQAVKLPVEIGSRIIKSVTALADKRFKIQFENEEHVFAYVDPRNPGMNTYKIWEAGGSHPFYPDDPYRINSNDEPFKTMGSKWGGVMRGDTCGITLPDLELMRFIIEEAQPHGYDEALGYGDSTIEVFDVKPLGFFKASEDNTEISEGSGVFGTIIPPATGDMISDGGVTTWTRLEVIDRPASLAAGQYWVDGAENGIYFSPSDDTKNLTVRYGVIGKDGETFTESYTIDTTVQLLTEIPWDDWNGAAVKLIRRLESGAEVTDYTASEVSDKLALLFNGQEANRVLSVRLETASPAPFPGEEVTYRGNGYEAIAKKQDGLVLIDESGVIAAKQALLPGTAMKFFWSDGVFYPDTSADNHFWTPWGNDAQAQAIRQGGEPGYTEFDGAVDFGQVASSFVVTEHGRGNIYIKESFFTSKATDRFCWKAVVLLLDHRGYVPQSLITKTQATFDALRWVFTGMGGGAGSFQVTEELGRTYEWVVDGGGCVIDREMTDEQFITEFPPGTPIPPLNYFMLSWMSPHETDTGSGLTFARLDWRGGAFGHPPEFDLFEDGCVIQSARGEVQTTSLKFTHAYLPHVGGGFVDTELDNVQAAFIAFLRGGGIMVLGTFPTGDVENGTTDVDMTTVMQVMYAMRNSGQFIGFGAVVMPPISGALGGQDAFAELLVEPPGWFYFPEGQTCIAEWEFSQSFKWEWGNIAIGRIVMQVLFPSGDTRDVVIDRFPSMLLTLS